MPSDCAFGMVMPGRNYSAGSEYRYGFNGKENDPDAGEAVQDYGMRIYDGRLGKFLSVDPLSVSYPWYTPYQFAGNKPIQYIDLDGLEEAPPDNFQPWVEFGIGVLEGFFALDQPMPLLTTCGTEYERLRSQLWVAKRNAEITAQSIERNGIVGWAVNEVGTVVGNLEDVVISGTPRQKGQLVGNVISIVIPVAGEVRATLLARRAAALSKTTVVVATALEEVSEVAIKSVDNAVTSEAASKAINKNSKIAEGDFMLYDVHADGPKQGELLKIGKADEGRMRADGKPDRMVVSQRKARKQGYPNATATPRKSLGKTTTGAATEAEAIEVKKERANGNRLPLNKGKSKKYKN